MNRTRRKAMKLFRRKYGVGVDANWCERRRRYVLNRDAPYQFTMFRGDSDVTPRPLGVITKLINQTTLHYDAHVVTKDFEMTH